MGRIGGNCLLFRDVADFDAGQPTMVSLFLQNG